MTIEFHCPCGQKMAVPPEMAGRQGVCPGCGEVLTVPPAPAAPGAEPPGDGSKVCPYCGERIRSAAIKCRYCGEFLDPQVRAERMASQGSGPTRLNERILVECANMSLGYGIASVVVFGCGVVFAPMALVKAREARGLAKESQLPLPGQTTAGQVLGWVSLVLYGGGLLLAWAAGQLK